MTCDGGRPIPGRKRWFGIDGANGSVTFGRTKPFWWARDLEDTEDADAEMEVQVITADGGSDN